MSSCFRFECEMVPLIVNSLSGILNQSTTIAWAPEFTKGYRQIDILAVSLANSNGNKDEATRMASALRKLSHAQMEILSFLAVKGHATPQYLAKRTWLNLAEIKNHIMIFLDLGLVERIGKRSYRPTIWAKQTPRCIVSIEAKLSDWPDALKQALYNKPAVDFSYAAFPLNVFCGRKSVLEEFRKHGIGVLGITKIRNSEILVYPRREPVHPADYLATAIKVSKELTFSDKWRWLHK